MFRMLKALYVLNNVEIYIFKKIEMNIIQIKYLSKYYDFRIRRTCKTNEINRKKR